MISTMQTDGTVLGHRDIVGHGDLARFPIRPEERIAWYPIAVELWDTYGRNLPSHVISKKIRMYFK